MTLQCNVCLKEVDCDIGVLSPCCQQVFHHECLANWIRLKPICPLCEGIIESNDDFIAIPRIFSRLTLMDKVQRKNSFCSKIDSIADTTPVANSQQQNNSTDVYPLVPIHPPDDYQVTSIPYSPSSISSSSSSEISSYQLDASLSSIPSSYRILNNNEGYVSGSGEEDLTHRNNRDDIVPTRYLSVLAWVIFFTGLIALLIAILLYTLLRSPYDAFAPLVLAMAICYILLGLAVLICTGCGVINKYNGADNKCILLCSHYVFLATLTLGGFALVIAVMTCVQDEYAVAAFRLSFADLVNKSIYHLDSASDVERAEGTMKYATNAVSFALLSFAIICAVGAYAIVIHYHFKASWIIWNLLHIPPVLFSTCGPWASLALHVVDRRYTATVFYTGDIAYVVPFLVASSIVLIFFVAINVLSSVKCSPTGSDGEGIVPFLVIFIFLFSVSLLIEIIMSLPLDGYTDYDICSKGPVCFPNDDNSEYDYCVWYANSAFLYTSIMGGLPYRTLAAAAHTAAPAAATTTGAATSKVCYDLSSTINEWYGNRQKGTKNLLVATLWLSIFGGIPGPATAAFFICGGCCIVAACHYCFTH